MDVTAVQKLDSKGVPGKSKLIVNFTGTCKIDGRHGSTEIRLIWPVGQSPLYRKQKLVL